MQGPGSVPTGLRYLALKAPPRPLLPPAEEERHWPGKPAAGNGRRWPSLGWGPRWWTPRAPTPQTALQICSQVAPMGVPVSAGQEHGTQSWAAFLLPFVAGSHMAAELQLHLGQAEQVAPRSPIPPSSCTPKAWGSTGHSRCAPLLNCREGFALPTRSVPISLTLP